MEQAELQRLADEQPFGLIRVEADINGIIIEYFHKQSKTKGEIGLAYHQVPVELWPAFNAAGNAIVKAGLDRVEDR